MIMYTFVENVHIHVLRLYEIQFNSCERERKRKKCKLHNISKKGKCACMRARVWRLHTWCTMTYEYIRTCKSVYNIIYTYIHFSVIMDYMQLLRLLLLSLSLCMLFVCTDTIIYIHHHTPCVSQPLTRMNWSKFILRGKRSILRHLEKYSFHFGWQAGGILAFVYLLRIWSASFFKVF